MLERFSFRLLARDGAARCGEIGTAHGTFSTPVFMPVGTQATVKGCARCGAPNGTDIVLGNTYHLCCGPASNSIARAGGLHKFMGWDRAILTDWGGYQVMSPGELRRLGDTGSPFARTSTVASVADARTVIEMQTRSAPTSSCSSMNVSSCRPPQRDGARHAVALALGRRSKRAFAGSALGRVVVRDRTGWRVRGVAPRDRPRYRANWICTATPSAVSRSASRSKELRVTRGACVAAAEHKPRYLMGVGTPPDMVEAVARGVDMFDCVLPTRNGRTAPFSRRFAAD